PAGWPRATAVDAEGRIPRSQLTIWEFSESAMSRRSRNAPRAAASARNHLAREHAVSSDSTLVQSVPAPLATVAPGRAKPARRPLRLVLVQTQAEGAGAQEISRILGQGLDARGYDVHHVFFFRRTA